MKNKIGVVSSLTDGAENLSEVSEYGLAACQLVSWKPEMWTDAMAAAVVEKGKKTGLTISSFWAGWSGPKVWDFIQGPSTLGIVPEEYRARRVEELKAGGDFTRKCGLPAVITHLGFIPENPGDPLWPGVVDAVRAVAVHLKNLGLEFWFETGQETPTAMLRLIETVGTGNLGLNLDPANLILYGKANPIDSLDVFGKYVRNIHVKDGFYPTDPMELGREVVVGAGKVRFPEFMRRLREIGFEGELIIEREISGDEQKRDIRKTVTYLEELMAEIG